MTVFRSTNELYKVMDTLFNRLANDSQVSPALLKGKMVVRFQWSDPDGEATIDLMGDSITYTLGRSDLIPDVVFIQNADNAHRFWLGELSVPQAIATRKVIAKGSVSKALKLLPAIQPAFAVYRQVLLDMGHEDLLTEREDVKKRGQPGWRFWQSFRSQKNKLPDFSMLNRHYIPLVDDLEQPGGEPIQTPDLGFTDERHLKLEMLRRMLIIRSFEQHLSQAFHQGLLPTEAIHLSIGQEATAVGSCMALKLTDTMTTTHRGHGHMLAKGADVNGMMAEMYGKATGLCKGKGGSMHVTDSRVGALGANGIVGASAVIAIGAALAYRQEGLDRVSLAFLGDGATNQGMFHEALNFAAVFDLPVIIVIENNLYGEFTPIAKHSRVKKLVDRAGAYGMPGKAVDGNDAWAVYETVSTAVNRARAGEGPSLIECLTYRWHGHMEGESAKYRTEDEVAAWKARDPIIILRDRLVEEGHLDQDAFKTMEAEAFKLIARAEEEAIAAPIPPLAWLTEDVFAPDPASLYRSQTLPPATRSVSYAEALWEGLAEEMARDPAVFLLGEDVSTGGYFTVTAGLGEEFIGRVLDTPISEYAIGGAAVGAALCGRRPVAEILFSDFLTTCMDPIMNQAAKLRYMSGGQYMLPLVIRTPGGAGLGMAAQHSQSLEALLTGVPGLIIIAPSTPMDAKGLLKSAIRSNNPVLFFENKLLYLEVGIIPDEEYIIPIGVADVKRAGSDVTVVAVGGMVPVALEAAQRLAREGIDVEVVDPRTLVPLDFATIISSLQKTGRLVTVEEAPLSHGFGAEIIARLAELAPDLLKAPPERVGAYGVPIAYARNLERAAVPDAERVLHAVQAVMA